MVELDNEALHPYSIFLASLTANRDEQGSTH